MLAPMIDRSRIDAAIDEKSPQLVELSRRIHEHPELRWEEHQAAGWIADLLDREGCRVERAVHGMPTAFRSDAGSRRSPRVAILAEYDALPEIGHACGHNLIAAGAVGAYLALAQVSDELPGSVVLLGTPAEEGGGGKIRLMEKGAFEGVDAAMMFHPFDRDLLAHPALASVWLTFAFTGRPAHAAARPHEGASALTACLETFRLIDSQRVHFRDGVRVHGFVTNGGQAVNIIPEHAASEFSVRARTSDELVRVRAIVERCARAAAMACDVEVAIDTREGYREMRNNMTIAGRYGAALEALGRRFRVEDPSMGAGSTDMGDVSLAVPSIHPYMGICDEGETLCHEHAFTAAAGSDRGMKAMLAAAKAMARTTLDLLEQPSLLADAQREFGSSE
jgi:amidohydrolase